MKLKPSIFLAISFLLLSSFSVNAAECNFKDPSPIQLMNGRLLGSHIQNTLNLLEQSYASQGKELRAVFVGRMGTDPGKSRVLSNYDSNGNFMPSLDSYRDWAVEKEDDFLARPTALQEEFSKDDRQLKYSHFGIAVKIPENYNFPGDIPAGEWVIAHLLRSCGNDYANLHNEGFWPFLLDDPDDYGAQIVVPKPHIQNRLNDLVFKEKSAQFLMAQFYNVTAEWDDVSEQNSVSWPLEMLALAQKPEGWMYDNLDAGPLDPHRFLKEYAQLKDRQNQLIRDFAHTYDTKPKFESWQNEDERQYQQTKNEIQQVNHLITSGYYKIFKKARALAQGILAENSFLPTRVLLLGKANMAKSSGPGYLKFRKDNGKNDLVRAITMISFREYAADNQLIDTDHLQQISTDRSLHGNALFPDEPGFTPEWGMYGLEERNLTSMQNGIFDICLLGRLYKPGTKIKSPEKMNLCKRFHN